SLDQRKDIVNDALRSANGNVIAAKVTLNTASIKRQQLQAMRESGGNMVELPFIASNGLISSLTSQLAGQKIALATLKERYRAKHPRYIEASNAILQTERELANATATAAAQVESDYQN